MKTVHSPQVLVGGSTNAPGLFGWRCSCGAGARDPNGTYQGWSDAEAKAVEHLQDAEANGDQVIWRNL